MEPIKILCKDFSEISLDNIKDDQEKHACEAFLNELQKPDYGGFKLKEKINRNPATEDLNKDLKPIVVTDGKEVRRAEGIIGYIRNKNFDYEGKKYDISLQIRTRYDRDEKKCFFLAEMVRCYAEKYLDISFSEMEIPTEEEKLLELLKICIFRKRVLDAYRVGFYKRYTYFKENDAKPRGRIDIARHIKENIALGNGRIAYEYRENTVDNPVNHLILRTWLELRKEYSDITDRILSRELEGVSANEVLQQLQYLAPHYRDKSLKGIIEAANVPVTSIYFAEYEGLRSICIDILNGLCLSIYTGSNELEDDVDSMLFYVPDLWEVYVEDLLRSVYAKDPSQGNYPNGKVSSQNEYWALYEKGKSDKGKKGCFVNRPDFIVEDEKKVLMVLDAKYKPVWSEFKKNESWVSDDVRQVLSYGMITGAKKVGVIYPIEPDDEKKTTCEIFEIGLQKENKRACENGNAEFLVCGLAIPSIGEKNFETWKKELKSEVDALSNKMPKVTE